VIDQRDVAAVAVRVLTDDGHSGAKWATDHADDFR
jgi:hypothetical protein